MKIVKALQTRKHNTITAIYHLLVEREQQKHPDRKWNFEDQKRYARTLGFDLDENCVATVRSENAVEDNIQDIIDNSVVGGLVVDNVGVSEYTAVKEDEGKQ